LMDLLDGLNPAQQEAVQIVEGPLLVLAGPGSGKTRVITHRIAFLVKEAGVNPRNILAVTFSKKAAEEMKRRLDHLLGDISASLSVGTFHAVCLRILRAEGIPGLGKNFEVCDEDEQNKLIKECMENAGLDAKEHDWRKYKAAVSYAKVKMIDPGRVSVRPGERLDDATLAVYRSYQRTLKKKRAVDYDDMLVFTYRLFRESEDVLIKYQKAYRHILVDEFQDTNDLQYQLVKLLGSKYGNVCAVGDPDQTIYSWRQAEIRNILSFSKDFPGTKVIGMQQNYRSTRTIVEAANSLIASNRLRLEKQLRTSQNQGDRISLIKLYDEKAEAGFVASEIARLVEKLSLHLSDFAVLYRVNAQSRALEDAFCEAGMPYKMIGGTPFYQRREIVDMIAWLRVMRNTADDAALARVLKVSGKGIGPQTMNSMLESAASSRQHLVQMLERAAAGTGIVTSKRAREALARFNSLLKQLQAESRGISLVTLMNRIIERTGYQDILKAEEDGEERWENVLELMSLARDYEHLSPVEALGHLLQKVLSASEAAASSQENEAVIFHTLHGAKGTEFPVIFMVGVEEGLLPHGKSKDSDEKLEEERRLCYVGITRAMELVYLTFAETRRVFGNNFSCVPSRFIGEIPERLIQFKDFSQPVQVNILSTDAQRLPGFEP
jgi:DNA helicase-2/ATP-dependent DNA helicase PcrA